MALEPKPESLPDDEADDPVGKDQAFLTARVHNLLDAFNEVMVAIHCLKGPQEIREAKEWVLGVVDELADMLEPGIGADDDDHDEADHDEADAEHLLDAAVPSPGAGLGPVGFAGEICDMTDFFEDEAVNAKVDQFLAELAEGVQTLRDDHPMRVFCKMLHRGRDGFRKARAVKKARDEFESGLGLPPV